MFAKNFKSGKFSANALRHQALAKGSTQILPERTSSQNRYVSHDAMTTYKVQSRKEAYFVS